MDVVNSPWKDNKLAILIIFPFGKFVEVAAAASRLASICAPTSLASVHTVFKFTCKTYSQQTLRQQFHSSRTRKICIIPLPSHHPRPPRPSHSPVSTVTQMSSRVDALEASIHDIISTDASAPLPPSLPQSPSIPQRKSTASG